MVHNGRASLLLDKDSFPLLPAARRLGQLPLRCLLSSRRLGQLPLLPIVIGCGGTVDAENNAPETKRRDTGSDFGFALIAVAKGRRCG